MKIQCFYLFTHLSVFLSIKRSISSLSVFLFFPLVASWQFRSFREPRLFKLSKSTMFNGVLAEGYSSRRWRTFHSWRLVRFNIHQCSLGVFSLFFLPPPFVIYNLNEILLMAISVCHRFHQVDSDDLTIAVNFWWRSNIVSNMSEHMDAYYLRIILRRFVVEFLF